jgi:hypothetical protein
METTGPGNLHAVEQKAGHELTFNLDHSMGADQRLGVARIVGIQSYQATSSRGVREGRNMARVSSVFGLSNNQANLDFVDVDLSTDMQLYVDHTAGAGR